MRESLSTQADSKDLFNVDQDNTAHAARSVSASDNHSREIENVMSIVRKRLQHQRKYGRIPLFILGAGISNGVVPLMSDIGEWLHAKLLEEESDIQEDQKWVMNHARAIASNTATRRQAAELFYALQEQTRQRHAEPFHTIWRDFSQGFLVNGLELNKDKWPEKFPGLRSEKVKPTKAHEKLAQMLSEPRAYVVSLNFDGLTRMALSNLGQGGLAVHSEEDLRTYFTADTGEFIPIVIKVRGDVFYAQCEGDSCPLSHTEYPLDRFVSEENDPEKQHPLRCPICSRDTLRLQFSFPGYRAKEEAAHPMLWTTRRFLGSRLSAIIILGLSGRWDRYLLRFLFDFARERELLVVDVNPSEQDNFLNSFRSTYYSSIPKLDGPNGMASVKDEAAFVRIHMKANEFMERVIEF
ncbi:MAG: hypothetical protein ICV60_15005 [Pyrinomonadaceae bacterium]|nr:hypothetical protein [Pyrinomonadaceae bacterium]